MLGVECWVFLPIPMSTAAPETLTRHIAIAGNPNCGKTTIFNALTGMRQKTGNYPGVTVERKIGRFRGAHGEPMDLLDLPGSYSLQVRSPDEAVARDVLLGRRDDTARPDVIICVLDASNIERNLYLLAQLLEIRLPLVVALNMVDVAEENGVRIDLPALEKELGVPVIRTVATKGVGLVELKQAVSRANLPKPAVRAPMPALFEKEAHALASQLSGDPDTAYSEALLLLTLHDRAQIELTETAPKIVAATQAAQARLVAAGLDPVSAPVEARYDWIHEICSRAVTHPGDTGLTFSDKLDAILTHRIWGSLAFLAVMALMFFCIFWVAQKPMDWIDAGAAALADFVKAKMPDGDFRSLITDGIIAGVGGVVIFLPQILILYFFLGLLEDSGYMARAAFMMDRLMSRVGLHGKSFIPMLSSFACAIPGIMATRTIEHRKDRLVTILVAPLMSCSARLPVYGLMIAVLMPAAGAWKKAGVMLIMYLIGIVAAFVMRGFSRRPCCAAKRRCFSSKCRRTGCPAGKASRCACGNARASSSAARAPSSSRSPFCCGRCSIIPSPLTRTLAPRKLSHTASAGAWATRSSHSSRRSDTIGKSGSGSLAASPHAKFSLGRWASCTILKA